MLAAAGPTVALMAMTALGDSDNGDPGQSAAAIVTDSVVETTLEPVIVGTPLWAASIQPLAGIGMPTYRAAAAYAHLGTVGAADEQSGTATPPAADVRLPESGDLGESAAAGSGVTASTDDGNDPSGLGGDELVLSPLAVADKTILTEI